MKKKVLSIVLALCLLLGLMPLPAMAEGDGSTHDHTGWTKLNQGNISDYYIESDNGYYKLNGGSYVLSSDITLDGPLRVANWVNLCLDGHDLKLREGASGPVIGAYNNTTLNLYDCNKSKEHETRYGRWEGEKYNIYEKDKKPNDATCKFDEITGGIITGGKGDEGGGVNSPSSTTNFNMYGGTIAGNIADKKTWPKGGGVYKESGTFTMHGGAIVGNRANGNGGGVYNKYGTFNLVKGSIANNKGTGVYNKCTFKMEDGSIADNKGCGVYHSGGTFTMTGGSITGNSSEGVKSFDNFAMNDGLIANNGTAGKSCDAVYHSGGTFTMTGGSIADNKGYGVYHSRGTFTMTGGSITGNKNTYHSGGVYNNGIFNLSGKPVIKDNKKGGADSNVYLGKEKMITVTGDLQLSEPIGVSIGADNNTTFPVRIVTGCADTTKFRLESGDYRILVSGDGNGLVLDIPSYTVSFDMKGHGTAPGEQTVKDGGKVIKPDDPAAAGWSFGGWYKEAECTHKWNFDRDTVTEGKTLYAKWLQNEETPAIKIDYTGGKITGLENGAQYGITPDGGTETVITASGTTLNIDSGWFGKTLTIVKKGNGTTKADSTAQSLTIEARPGTPAVTGTYSVNADGATVDYTVDSISGAEYRADGGSWQPGNVFTKLNPTVSHTFEARIKAVAGGSFCSAIGSKTESFVKLDGSAGCSVSILPAGEKWTYGDAAKMPTSVSSTNGIIDAEGNGTVTYFYKVKDADDSTYKTVQPTAAGNYTIKAVFDETAVYSVSTATDTFTIDPKPLTVTVTVKNKPYDGTNTATIDSAALEGVLDGDKNDNGVKLTNGTATFRSAAVGTNIPIDFTDFTISGTAAGNYTLTNPQPTGVTANITNTWNPAENTEYTLSDVSGTDGWRSSALTVTAKPGYKLSLTNTAEGTWSDSLTGSTEGEDSQLTFYVKNADGVISLAETVNYKLDITAPTGTVKIDEKNKWQEFISDITFGLFFKDTKNLTIDAEDTGGSHVAKIEYLKSAEAKELAEIKAVTGWTEYKSAVSVPAKDAEQAIFYARITDNAGNVTYLSSQGMVFDTTAPDIKGVTDKQICYTTQKVTVSDTNLESVKLGTAEQTLNQDVTLAPVNAETTYIITATDEASNVATVTVTMKPLGDVMAPVSTLAEANVKSSDGKKIKDVQALITALLADRDTTDDEKTALSGADYKGKVEALLQKIKDVGDDVKTQLDAVAGYTAKDDAKTLETSDKTGLEKIIADIDKLLDTDNLTAGTDGQRTKLENAKKAAEALVKKITDDAAALDKALAKVKDGAVEVPRGADQKGKTAAVQSYVDGLLTGTGATANVTHKSGDTYAVALTCGSAAGSKDITVICHETGSRVASGTSEVAKPAEKAGATQAQKDAMQKASEALQGKGGVKETGLDKAVGVKKNDDGDFIVDTGAEKPVTVKKAVIERILNDKHITGESTMVAETYLQIQVTDSETDAAGVTDSLTFDIKPFVKLILISGGHRYPVSDEPDKPVENVTKSVTITL